MGICQTNCYFLYEEGKRFDINRMKYDFSYPEFQNISQEGKDLIASILVPKEKRPSITEILEHKWIKEFAPHSTGASINIDWGHIKKYSRLNLLQKSVINFTINYNYYIIM